VGGWWHNLPTLHITFTKQKDFVARVSIAFNEETQNQNILNMDYSDFKQTAIDEQPVYYHTKLSNVDLESLNSVSVEGNNLQMESSAVEDLHDIVGMSNKFGNHVQEVLGDDARVGLIRALRSGLANKKGLNVSVALDRKNKSVSGFSTDMNHITAEGFFDLVERMMDRYGLDLFNHNFILGSNKIAVGVKANKRLDLTGFSGMEDEMFGTGMTFMMDRGEMRFLPQIERLWCTNQLIGTYDSDYNISGLDDRNMESFFEKFDNLAQNGFIREDLTDYINRAANTRASVDEVMKSRALINEYKAEDGPNAVVGSLIPVAHVRDAYADLDDSPNVRDMSITQKKNALTDMSVWDVINGLTRFASHDYTSDGFNITDGDQVRLQRCAGNLLEKKTLDCENVVPNPFGL